MSRKTAIPKDSPARSHLAIWRQGWALAWRTSLSVSPRARASTRAWSWALTMSWSRSLAERSFKKNRATTKVAMDTRPEMMNWLCQSTKWLRVRLATMLTMRLPATGPTVQKPMAEARPSCGL